MPSMHQCDARLGACLSELYLRLSDPHCHPPLCPNQCSGHRCLHRQQGLHPSRCLLDPPQPGPSPLLQICRCPMLCPRHHLQLCAIPALQGVPCEPCSWGAVLLVGVSHRPPCAHVWSFAAFVRTVAGRLHTCRSLLPLRACGADGCVIHILPGISHLHLPGLCAHAQGILIWGGTLRFQVCCSEAM